MVITLRVVSIMLSQPLFVNKLLPLADIVTPNMKEAAVLSGIDIDDKEDMEKAQGELKDKTVETTAGGGMIKIVVNGHKEILSINISQEVVDPEDVEMLEDLIRAATNEALRKMDEENESSMSQITGGMGGGFPF